MTGKFFVMFCQDGQRYCLDFPSYEAADEFSFGLYKHKIQCSIWEQTDKNTLRRIF